MAKKLKSKKRPYRTSKMQGEFHPSLLSQGKPSDSLIKLWPKQEEAAQFVLSRPQAALFFEQRTGKTFISMSVLDRLPREDMAVVLVCLLNNKETTWKDKISEFLPWLNLTDSWDEFKTLPFPKLLLVHFDIIYKLAAKLKRVKWITFMIVDEAHRLKARGTRQSRSVGRLSGVPKKLILTGTPIEKQPKDLWGQFRFLAPEVFGTWPEFEEEYLDFDKVDMEGIPKGTEGWKLKIIRQGMLKSRAKFRKHKLPQLIELIKPYALRLRKTEVGILPPEIVKVIVEIKGNQRWLYKRMKRHSVIRLEGGQRAMAPLTVTNIIKRRQLASGFVYDDEGECHHIGRAKLDKLISLFNRLPKPVVIFTVFKPELEIISEALIEEGYDIATVSGKTKKGDRVKILRGFQLAQYDGLVCQTKVGGAGLDMWKASYGIAHSISHSSIDFEQMTSRLDAKDKKTPAKIYILCGQATIDEDLYTMVVEKGLSSEETLKQLKKGAQ